MGNQVKEKSFPHHSGGVIQVRHSTRFGVVPEALLEDKRIDLDSRLVAAWLAVKSDGWQIHIETLRRKLALEGTDMLGKDRWQRISRELKAAGYLASEKRHSSSGLWVWHITFTPIPSLLTVGGLSGYGDSGNGVTNHGSSVGGQPGHKTISTEQKSTKPLPPRRTAAPAAWSGGSDLKFEEAISEMKDQLLKILAPTGLDPTVAQQLLDELVGVIEAGKRGGRTPLVAPIAWFRRLVQKALAGEFDHNYCDRIANRRDGTAARTAENDSPWEEPTDDQKQLARQHIADIKNTLRRSHT